MGKKESFCPFHHPTLTTGTGLKDVIRDCLPLGNAGIKSIMSRLNINQHTARRTFALKLRHEVEADEAVAASAVAQHAGWSEGNVLTQSGNYTADIDQWETTMEKLPPIVGAMKGIRALYAGKADTVFVRYPKKRGRKPKNAVIRESKKKLLANAGRVPKSDKLKRVLQKGPTEDEAQKGGDE